MSDNDICKEKVFDYNNLPALDDNSEENIKKTDDLMEFFYQQALKNQISKQ